MIAAKSGGYGIAHDTIDWLEKITEELTEKLARVGLIESREQARLGPFLEQYVAQRKADLKKLTLSKLYTTRDYLLDYFGADKSLRDITEGDADEWRRHLLAGKGGKGKASKRSRSENTVRKHAQVAKQFFTAAVRKRLIRENPFSDLPATVRPNPKRFYFVTREEAAQVLETCPDSQWRLLFALSRFGGLRCPSELLTLRWEDVNWDLGRVLITSPKTEHHEGKDSRQIPLFPELRPYLEEAWDLAEPGAEYVIARYRDREANLRTQLTRIIKRAGLEPWPKIFQNMRSTRQTELEEKFPSHVVCVWMGNNESVAKKHYLQVTDNHFEKALAVEIEPSKVAQKAAHQMRRWGADQNQGKTRA